MGKEITIEIPKIENELNKKRKIKRKILRNSLKQKINNKNNINKKITKKDKIFSINNQNVSLFEKNNSLFTKINKSIKEINEINFQLNGVEKIQIDFKEKYKTLSKNINELNNKLFFNDINNLNNTNFELPQNKKDLISIKLDNNFILNNKNENNIEDEEEMESKTINDNLIINIYNDNKNEEELKEKGKEIFNILNNIELCRIRDYEYADFNLISNSLDNFKFGENISHERFILIISNLLKYIKFHWKRAKVKNLIELVQKIKSKIKKIYLFNENIQNLRKDIIINILFNKSFINLPKSHIFILKANYTYNFQEINFLINNTHLKYNKKTIKNILTTNLMKCFYYNAIKKYICTYNLRNKSDFDKLISEKIIEIFDKINLIYTNLPKKILSYSIYNGDIYLNNEINEILINNKKENLICGIFLLHYAIIKEIVRISIKLIEKEEQKKIEINLNNFDEFFYSLFFYKLDFNLINIQEIFFWFNIKTYLYNNTTNNYKSDLEKNLKRIKNNNYNFTLSAENIKNLLLDNKNKNLFNEKIIPINFIENYIDNELNI